MVLQKLQQARAKIKQLPTKKEGYNEYSKYKYFTPEQIATMVHDACQEFGLFTKFDLLRTDLGLMAFLEVYDTDEPDKPLTFKMATDIPAIKATNIAQQLGGCVTYSERYLNQIAFDIKDNNLDFDSKDNSGKQLLSADQVNQIEKLIRSSTYEDEKQHEMMSRLSGLTSDKFDETVQRLMLSQKSPNENENMNQGDINKELDMKLKNEKA
jgi:hypothetical protein